jgi:hypothetical protein
MPDPIDQIKDASQRPRSASGDFGTYTEHSLRDQIEAAKFATREDVAKRKQPFRLSGFAPGSAVGGER